MKVILTQDVRGKGKKGQMIEAAEGYARNYLIPRGVGVAATTKEVKNTKMRDEAKAKDDTEDKAVAEAIAEKLQGCQVKIAAKGGNEGKLFGAVTSAAIADALKAQYDMDVDSKKLVIDEPIKSFGSYQVKAKLGYEISGIVNVLVIEEK